MYTKTETALTNKLAEWGFDFHLHNLSNRLPPDWQVRDLT